MYHDDFWELYFRGIESFEEYEEEGGVYPYANDYPEDPEDDSGGGDYEEEGGGATFYSGLKGVKNYEMKNNLAKELEDDERAQKEVEDMLQQIS